MISVKSIRVVNFKGVNDINLKNVARLNYIVGKNGSGKTSIFEAFALAFRNTNGDQAFRSFGDVRELLHNSSCEISICFITDSGEKNDEYILSTTNGTNLEISAKIEDGSLNTRDIQILTSINPIFSENNSASQDPIQRIVYTNSYSPRKNVVLGPNKKIAINELNSFQDEFIGEVGYINRASSDQLPNELNRLREQKTISVGILSYGQESRISMMLAIENNKSRILVIEEPENGLHPEWHATIHDRLSEYLEQNEDVTIFVITHSPFIISRASETKDKATKVYIIKDGVCVDPEGCDPLDARYLGAIELGAEGFSLAPRKLVFSEKSLATLLRNVNDRYYKKSILFREKKGRDNQAGASDQQLLSLAEDVERLFEEKFNLLDQTEDVWFIVDSLSDHKDKQRFENLKQKNAKIIELSKYKLEDYYDDIKSIAKEEIKDLEKIDKARIVGNRITKDEFETVFSELLVLFE